MSWNSLSLLIIISIIGLIIIVIFLFECTSHCHSLITVYCMHFTWHQWGFHVACKTKIPIDWMSPQKSWRQIYAWWWKVRILKEDMEQLSCCRGDTFAAHIIHEWVGEISHNYWVTDLIMIWLWSERILGMVKYNIYYVSVKDGCWQRNDLSG